MQSLEELLRSPPAYPDGLIGRNVSLASGGLNDSYPSAAGGGGAIDLGYGEAGAAAGGINSTQGSEGQVIIIVDENHV